MTCDASSDFGLTTSDFDFSLECGAFKDALRQAFMQAVNLQGVAPLLDTELDELNAAQMQVVDLINVLVDGKFVQDLKDPSLIWRGSSNQVVHHLR